MYSVTRSNEEQGGNFLRYIANMAVKPMFNKIPKAVTGVVKAGKAGIKTTVKSGAKAGVKGGKILVKDILKEARQASIETGLDIIQDKLHGISDTNTVPLEEIETMAKKIKKTSKGRSGTTSRRPTKTKTTRGKKPILCKMKPKINRGGGRGRGSKKKKVKRGRVSKPRPKRGKKTWKKVVKYRAPKVGGVMKRGKARKNPLSMWL